MGKKIDKITKHNLGPRILQLLTEEGRNSGQIAKILTDEGFKISQPTVSRWLAKERETHQAEVKDIVHKHVAEVVPEDLKALEEMEKQCLDWSREGPDIKSERIVAWPKILDTFHEVKNSLLTQDEKEFIKEMKAFYQRCLHWIIEDLNNQKDRLSAMREARSIIDTKLKYSGILEGATAGNIFIGPTKDGENPKEDDTAPHERLLHLVGKDNEE
jgi:predicted transcriptional regulator